MKETKSNDSLALNLTTLLTLIITFTNHHRCATYIDDGLWAASSYEEACMIRDIVLKDMEDLGLLINTRKAHLVPCQAVTYLGHIYDTSGPAVRLYVPEKKVQSIVEDVQDLLTRVEKDPSRAFRGATVARVVGRVLSIKHAYGPARLVTRHLLAALRDLPLRTVTIKGVQHRVRNYYRTVRLGPGAVAELRFVTRLGDWNGLAWCTSIPTRIMYTDGSGSMYGGLTRAVVGGAEGQVLSATQGDHSSTLTNRQSVHTEEAALLRCLIDLEEDLRGHTVLHRTDSLATLYAVQNGGYCTKDEGLNLMAIKVWYVCVVKGIRLCTEYVGSEGIIRSGADTLSRQRLKKDDDRCRLRPELFSEILRLTGLRPDLDAFGEPGPGGSQGGLPYYVGRVEDASGAGCVGYDALAMPWAPVTYAYPPLHLDRLAVEKALHEVNVGNTHAAILILPEWPRSIWFPLVRPFASIFLGGEEGPEGHESESEDEDEEDESEVPMPRRVMTLPDLTTLPRGATRPIESRRTWEATSLRAWIIMKSDG